MTKSSIMRKIGILLLGLVLILGLSGCSGPLAKLKINKTKKLLKEASEHEAEKYALDLQQAAESNLKQAIDKLATKDSKGALDNAKIASQKAEEAVNKSKRFRAGDKLKAAEDALNIAKKNDGQLENPEIFQRINDNFIEAGKKHRDEKWVSCITISLTILQDVEALLQRLKTTAIDQLKAVDQKIKDVKGQQAETYAPNLLLELEEVRQEIDELINKNNDYKNAIVTAGLAMKKAQDTITKIKEEKSKEYITEIENKLATAIVKGAELYARDLFDDTSSQFDILVKSFYNKEYDNVLASAPLLTSKVDELIIITKTESAKAKIKTVEIAIGQLLEVETRTFLPGRVEEVEKMLIQAKTQFDNKDYEKVEQTCANALEENERVLSAFKELANNSLNEAQQSLNTTREVYDKVDKIFIKKESDYMTPLEKDFENNKETMKAELGQILNSCDVLLILAHSNLEERLFNKAIEKSKDVKAKAENVLNETYHVVAHNAILELANSISFYEKEGGQDYAPVELDKTIKLLYQARELVDQKKFKDAVYKVSETKAQLETTIQVVREKAVKQIADAKKEITDSKTVKTNVYKEQDFKNANTLITSAEGLLKSESLKSAVQTAEQASSITKEASVEATKIWAGKSISTAEESIAKAVESGANIYSATELKQSQDMLKTAKELYEAKKYLTAKETAEKSTKFAEEARMKLVSDARKEIDIAKKYGGWKYQYELLSQAIIKANNAEKLLNDKDFINSRLNAQESIQISRDAANKSKQAEFTEKVGKIEANLATSLKSGANYFKVDDVKALMTDLTAVKKAYVLTNHEDTMSKLNDMEIKINKILIDTPEVLSKVIAQQTEEVKKIEESSLKKEMVVEIESAKKYLNYAKFDFKDEKYYSSYSNLQKAIELVNDMKMKAGSQLYCNDVRKLFSQLETAMKNFNSYLEITPSVLKSIAINGENNKGVLTSIHGRFTPLDFRNATDRLYALSLELNPPESMIEINKDVLYVLKCSNLAAKNFEKLSLADELNNDTIISIIDNAYDLIEKSKKKRATVQEQLIEPELRTKMIKAESVN